MPFTLSHPAASLVVAPLLGRFAVPSALAIGSMAPDFPYFAALPIPRSATHSLQSVLWFSLPVGWFAYLAFERALRAPAVQLLPRAVRLRIAPSPGLAPALAVTLSLIAGATTHVVWDAITHGTAGAVSALPPVAALVRALHGVPQLSFQVLQYGSSAIGAMALALYSAWWFRRTPEWVADPDGSVPERTRGLGRAAVLIVPALVGLLAALSWGPPIRDLASLVWFGVHMTVSGITACVGVVGATALWLRHPPAVVAQTAATRSRP